MSYELKTLAAPRSTGRQLRFLAGLAEGTFGGTLAKKFFNDIGIVAMRETLCDEAPASIPPVLALGLRSSAEGTPVETPAPAVAGPGFQFETVADFTAAYAAGETTPTEVAERLLAWVEASDAAQPPLRAFITQDREDLLAQAAASTARYAAGAPLGPLDGVPIGVKDEADQAGYPTTVGTKFLGTEPAAEDSTVVARLRAAGALLIGKLNMHEIGLGVTGLNPHHGAARNPYNSAHATGGSSSGPACAVAAGFGPLSVAADGGGSIRIPAALCGMVGLKATYGRISEHGAAPLCWSVAHLGPIAATARDAALGYLAMAGPDPHDLNSMAQPPVTLERFEDRDLTGLKLGIYRPWFEDAEAPIVKTCDAAVTHLLSLGATLHEVDIPDLHLLRTAHMVTIVSEMVTAHQRYQAKHRKDYGHDTRLNLALGRRMTNADYVHAQRLRTRFNAHFDAVFEAVDVLVTPSTARTAPPLPADALICGESNLENTDLIMRFAPAANMTGLPALTCPAGYDPAGLPIGVQFMGRAWSEDVLLRLAACMEAHVERRAPQVYRALLTAR